MAKEKKSNAGRKNDYYDKIKPNLKKIAKWLKAGALDKEVMQALNVSSAVWYKYLNMHKEFKDIAKESKDKSNLDILGNAYTLTEKQIVTEKKISIVNGVKTVTVTEKEVLPNERMCEFLLKNRMPEEFRDKQDLTVKGIEDINITISGVKPIEKEPKNDEKAKNASG